ncbi:hypothetical protein BDR04DRAFT_1226761 [Suillus decipiens]|nr:hypothetical protein BDR04DRAFT_1226761 [Suillus decipiens]
MALKYGFTIRDFFASIFRLFMEFPADVPGLFEPGPTQNTVASWRSVLSSSHLPQRCLLKKMTFCKVSNSKEHEFVLFYFHHWKPSGSATTLLVVDRTVDRNSTVPAVHGQFPRTGSAALTIPNEGSIAPFLKQRYTAYNELLTLDFSSASPSLRPSATDISILLSVISRHAPNYKLFHTQRFWYASTIWEATAILFPGCRDTIHKNGRSTYLGLKVGVTDSVGDICQDYHTKWSHVRCKAEQEREAEEAVRQQLRLEGLAEGLDKARAEGHDEAWAQAQARIVVLLFGHTFYICYPPTCIRIIPFIGRKYC